MNKDYAAHTYTHTHTCVFNAFIHVFQRQQPQFFDSGWNIER